MRKKIIIALVMCISLLLFGTVYARDTETSEVPVVRGHSLTVSGKDISVNFYLELDTSRTGNIKMSTGKDETKDKIVELSTLTTADEKKVLIDAKYHTCYAFSYPVVAKKMDEKVSLTFCAADGQETLLEEYCVNDYVKQVTESKGYALKFEEFANSMSTYGQFAKYYFNQSSASAEETTSLAGVTKDTLASYAMTKGTSFDNGACTYYGSSLTLESETTLNIYFKLNEGVDVSELSFSIVPEGGEAQAVSVESTTKNDTELCVIQISNIGAAQLGTAYTIKCVYEENDYELIKNCSALSYAYTVLKTYEDGDTKVNLVNLSKALYLYNQSATAYLTDATPEVYDLYYSTDKGGFYADPDCTKGVKVNAETSELELTNTETTEVTSFAQLNGTRTKDTSVWMLTSYTIAADEALTGPYVVRRYTGNNGNILKVTGGTATVDVKIDGSYTGSEAAYIARYLQGEKEVAFATGVYLEQDSAGVNSLVNVATSSTFVLEEKGVIMNNYACENHAPSYGSGIYTAGNVTIRGTVADNISGSAGGNIWIQGGSVTVDSTGVLRDGSALANGGNVRVQAGTFTVNGGTISGGSTDIGYNLGQGGNVYGQIGSAIILNGGEIRDGSTTYQGGNIYVGGNLTVKGGAKIYDGHKSNDVSLHGGNANVIINQWQNGTTYKVQLENCLVEGLLVSALDQAISITDGTIIQAPSESGGQGLVVNYTSDSEYTGAWLSMTSDYSVASIGKIEVTTDGQSGITVLEKGIALTDRDHFSVTSKNAQFMFEETKVTLQDASKHIHCACDGMTDISASECKSAHWDVEWTATDQLGGATKEDGGYYYLTGDVPDGGIWNLDSGGNVSICLNDKTYTGNGRAAIWVTKPSSLTLCNGTVAATGSSTVYGGCLRVNDDAKLTLYNVHLDASEFTNVSTADTTAYASVLWHHITNSVVNAYNSTYERGYQRLADGTTQIDATPICKLWSGATIDGLTELGDDTTDESGTFTVMGNNIGQALINENDYQWNKILPVERYKKLYAAYAHYMPDVIAFQECDEYWHDLIDNIDGKATANGVKAFSDLGYADATAGLIDYSIRAVRCPIYYNTQTMNVVDAGYVNFSNWPQGEEEHSGGPGVGVAPYHFSWAILESEETHKQFAVASTHIQLGKEDDTDTHRAMQIGELVSFMKKIENEKDIPVIMLGDFNTDPTEANAYPAFKINDELYSARDVASVVEGKGYTTTNSIGQAPEATDDNSTGVIDHCMISMSGIQADKYQTLVEQFDKEKGIHTYDYSDHVPQRFTFRIGE